MTVLHRWTFFIRKKMTFWRRKEPLEYHLNIPDGAEIKLDGISGRQLEDKLAADLARSLGSSKKMRVDASLIFNGSGSISDGTLPILMLMSLFSGPVRKPSCLIIITSSVIEHEIYFKLTMTHRISAWPPIFVTKPILCAPHCKVGTTSFCLNIFRSCPPLTCDVHHHVSSVGTFFLPATT